MKKLKLDVDQVQVVSFASETAERERGTVNGYATPVLACVESNAGSCYSCFPNYCLPMPATRAC